MNRTALKLAAIALRAMADELDGQGEAEQSGATLPPTVSGPRVESPAERLERDLIDAADEGQPEEDEPRPRRATRRAKRSARAKGRRRSRPAPADEEESEAARLIREAEEKHGGRRALVERFGFSEAMLSKWSTGARPCSATTLQRLRQAIASPAPRRGAREVEASDEGAGAGYDDHDQAEDDAAA
ncbi:MAG: hypothetical protein M9894_39655 [Planctomycetes bacterium]|nr:hypothetical protein [Planctomycetota bacterium]